MASKCHGKFKETPRALRWGSRIYSNLVAVACRCSKVYWLAEGAARSISRHHAQRRPTIYSKLTTAHRAAPLFDVILGVEAGSPV